MIWLVSPVEATKAQNELWRKEETVDETDSKVREVLQVFAWGRRGIHPGFWWGKSEGKRPLGRPRRRW
jgi:hypothetical protein